MEYKTRPSWLNKRVVVTHSKKQKYNKTVGAHGTVETDSGCDQIGVRIDGMTNGASGKGLFWYARSEVKKLDDMEENVVSKLEGYKFLAVIDTGAGYNQNYYYALYDESIKAGDSVIVTGNSQGRVLTVKDVVSADCGATDIPKNICAEVICSINTEAYKNRVENRKKADELRKQLTEKRKEIEARKDDEYYAGIDPAYATMLGELRALSQ